MDYPLKVSQSITFIPEQDGNREKAPEEQVVFELRYLTITEFDGCAKLVGRKVEFDTEKMLQLSVAGIKNLNITNQKGEKTAVNTVKEFMALPKSSKLWLLYKELQNFILRMDADFEEERKNL